MNIYVDIAFGLIIYKYKKGEYMEKINISTINEGNKLKVDKLIEQAFTNTDRGYGGEVDLTHKIREDIGYIKDLEVVATIDDEIVGHGLLSEVSIIREDGSSIIGLVLAPLSVSPEHQGSGIGGKIMRELERRAKVLRYPFINILGHPEYYPKFGYAPASKYQIQAPFEVADEAFMIKILDDKYINDYKGVKGIIKYFNAFS